MLNLIGDHLHVDPDIQSLTEQYAALQLHQTLQRNLAFFKHFYPVVFQQVIDHKLSRYSVFCSKDGEFNITELASGRVLYTAKPELEVLAEVDSFCIAAPVIFLDEQQAPPVIQLADTGEVVLMFGVGLGLQLATLLKKAAPGILVIYEPELDLFISSLHVIDWVAIFNLANSINCKISLQLCNGGVSIAADLTELTSLLPALERVLIYRHLAHPVSDEVFQYLREHSGQRSKLLRISRQFLGFNDDNLFVSERSAGILANYDYPVLKTSEVFAKNLQALKKYYPALYNIFVNYTPKYWHAVDTPQGINLNCSARSGLFYQSVLTDSELLVQRFINNPPESKVLLNQGGVEKFPTYIHYQAIKKLQPFLTNLPPRQLNELSDIDNVIILGVGLGLHIELLLQQCHITNLFIFEPNVDFFYASLFVTNWHSIFQEAENNNQRFYFNVGGTGDEYFIDVMGQYYQVGAYGLANSLFFPSFLTPGMRSALAKLQSQLLIIVAMGENFDHVRFGIAHIYQSLCRGHRFLKHQRKSSQLHLLQDVPVFIVGNGPSLDENYQYIKQHRQRVIVVSCGTALRSLYKLGITPDFHAEIEQNRATHSWVSQVDDKTWLKQIAFLSVSGVHPDTADMFKAVYLAFKDGESSVSFFRDTLQQKDIHVSSLSHAYPTVSNFALDFFTDLGFKQLYLFGIDLGYIDVESHHSKHSAYYHKDGAGVMDANKVFASGLQVKGNFRAFVQTKPEFDFSRSIMEITIANATPGCSIYNCSDGAYIQGAVPLLADNILLPSAKSSLPELLATTFNELFYTDELSVTTDLFKQLILANNVGNFVEASLELLKNVGTVAEAKNLVTAQWNYCVESYYADSKLGFYLLCGSTIYFLSVLTRFIPVKSNNASSDLASFNEILQIWREYLHKVDKAYTAAPFASCDVDISSLFKKPDLKS